MIHHLWQRLIAWFRPTPYHEPSLGLIARAERMERYMREIEGQWSQAGQGMPGQPKLFRDDPPRRFTR